MRISGWISDVCSSDLSIAVQSVADYSTRLMPHSPPPTAMLLHSTYCAVGDSEGSVPPVRKSSSTLGGCSIFALSDQTKRFTIQTSRPSGDSDFPTSALDSIK